MERRIINPWTWQDQFGFVQANEVKDAGRIMYCAGLVSVDAEGNPLHAGDMAKQIEQVFDNLETLLGQAGLDLSNIVRLTYYTTDPAEFTQCNAVLKERLQKGGCRPATSLIGVASLARPDWVVEMEATAAA
jgi:enamine deaminase RidA (YjgF/YER057c/UK114 family)